jgi:putative transposase
MCRENKLLLPRKKKKKCSGFKIAENRKINGPNQLWQFDIKYGYIHGENKFFYLLAFIDVFTREVISYYVGTTCKALDLTNTFAIAFEKLNFEDQQRLVIRSDRGPQMTSWMFKNYMATLPALHELIPVHNPNRNAYIESFFSIFEIAFLQVFKFENFSDAYAEVVRYINFYNTRRLHGRIGYITPSELKQSFDAGLVDSRDRVVQI